MDAFLNELWKAHQEVKRFPSNNALSEWLNGLLALLFPEFKDQEQMSLELLQKDWLRSKNRLTVILHLEHSETDNKAVTHFYEALPELRNLMLKDAQAIEIGDPAATSISQVVRSYPGFYAIAVFRLAHALYEIGYPLIARLLTELAHNQTGIDIHPAASIGERFFIDHGTGIVIGETTVIGNDVKLYQGVTLGALSVKKELANTKRHPTIEDQVVIYAGATILGGTTTIGKHSVIGGNVWLTTSVPEGSLVQHNPNITIEKKGK